ncbi:MAG: hypothetical protein LC737_05485, partial [Chloroflexi bacterium]|nr:hypothetical protein [Chloroflexota bacterium]
MLERIQQINWAPDFDVPHFNAAPEEELALDENEIAPNALRVEIARDELAAARLAPFQELWSPIQRGTPGDSLNVSEWVHVATQGRDHYVRIVYEGFLYPFRHRASLVKVTERKISNGQNGAPVAYLAQRMFIVVRQPLMDYEGERAADAKYGRHMPFRRVRLTTLITPDIKMPEKIVGTDSFWVKVGSEPFRFHAVGEDIGEKPINFSTALIFVPFSDYDAATISTYVRQEYLKKVDWRACPVPGQQVTFAERDGANGTDNTTLTTRVLHFTTDDVGGKDSYLFRPLLFKADVNLPAVEQLTGTNAPTQIAYYDPYLATGFADPANRTGLFA